MRGMTADQMRERLPRIKLLVDDAFRQLVVEGKLPPQEGRAGIGSNGGRQGVAPPIAGSLPPCPYLKPPTGEMILCESCGGRTTMLKVFGCHKVGTCLPTVSVPGRGFCGRCPHRPGTVTEDQRGGQQLPGDLGDGPR